LNNNLKIVSIGPYSPFRGGISDFNHHLVTQLKNSHDVTILNFKKLYPRIFFPGKSQYKNSISKSNSSLRILNPLNIFSWKKSIKKINELDTDIVIFSYWHPFFAIMYSYIAKRINTKKIYFLIHNAKSHQSFPFQKYLLKNMLNKATHLVVMNQNEIQRIKRYNLKAKIINSFHPIYEIDYHIDDRERFKNNLGIKSDPTILFFGLIRPYKGLDILINAVNRLKIKIPNLKVFVVGEPYTNLNIYLNKIKEYGLESSFIIDSNFVSKEDLSKYFLSSDLIVLPYKQATQSGILSLSMNFNLPAIVSSKGGLKDYVIKNETGYIVEPNEHEVALSIHSFFNENMYDIMTKNISNHKKNFSWEEFERSLKLYD
jgi:glycosyltransferase involved in cell wall biosynthesis|tara:strand:- start:6720 stop:7835 length:1116 start_codon:yes stop_codon:yes gene_type:complete